MITDLVGESNLVGGVRRLDERRRCRLRGLCRVCGSNRIDVARLCRVGVVVIIVVKIIDDNRHDEQSGRKAHQ